MNKVLSKDGTTIAFERVGDGPALILGRRQEPGRMRHAMQSVADVLPSARHRTLEGQTHMVNPKALRRTK
jgi:hypothetical protein